MKCEVTFTRKKYCQIPSVQFQNLKMALVRKMYNTVFHVCGSIMKVPAISK